MVFLHLLPSPSSCALLLTPKPPGGMRREKAAGTRPGGGEAGPKLQPALAPVGVRRLGGSGRPPGATGGWGWGWGLTARSGDPRTCRPLGVQLDPLSDLSSPRSFTLGAGTETWSAWRWDPWPRPLPRLDARERSGSSSPPPFPLSLPLPFSLPLPHPSSSVSFFLFSPSFLDPSFPFFFSLVL